MLVLSATEQARLLTMPDAIEAVATALRETSQHRTQTPVRTAIPVPEYAGTCLFMPSVVSAVDAAGLKFVSVFPKNHELGLPTIIGVMVLSDARTGAPLALLEGSRLTALRTGAASGLATHYLARRDASVLGVIGTGVQARSVIEAVRSVRSIEEIRLFNRTPGKGVQLAEELSEQLAEGRPSNQGDVAHGGSTLKSVRVVGTADEAVDSADIVVTTTNAEVPVFTAKAITPGTHINAVGSFKPSMQELPTELFRGNPKVVVEGIEAALAETGDLRVPIESGVFQPSDIHGELGELVDNLKPGRTTDAEITVFKSVGLAAMDVVVARAMYNRATAMGIGQNIELS